MELFCLVLPLKPCEYIIGISCMVYANVAEDTRNQYVIRMSTSRCLHAGFLSYFSAELIHVLDQLAQDALLG